MTLRQIRDIIAAAHDTDLGFIQQTETFDEGYTSEFRAFLRLKSGAFAERTRKTPKEAISEVFAALKLEIPNSLK